MHELLLKSGASVCSHRCNRFRFTTAWDCLLTRCIVREQQRNDDNETNAHHYLLNFSLHAPPEARQGQAFPSALCSVKKNRHVHNTPRFILQRRYITASRRGIAPQERRPLSSSYHKQEIYTKYFVIVNERFRRKISVPYCERTSGPFSVQFLTPPRS